MRTADFDYDLPPGQIAQAPLADRSASRMLVLRRADGSIEPRGVRDLPSFLRAGDLLVVNDTRVFPARVFGRRADTGGAVELLLLEEIEPGLWRSLYKASGRPRPGLRLILAGGELSGDVAGVAPGGEATVRFDDATGVLGVLDRQGVTPLPPYIHRPRDASAAVAGRDRERYQTVYAAQTGAVAAPTAGLHFTPELLGDIRARGVDVAAVTLHVGPGTFKPVKAERVEDHVMDPERYAVSDACAAAVQRARRAGGRIVAVGSTTVRTLETVAAEHGKVIACRGRSSLFIYPPFGFKVVDAMLTNFHLPKSTLLMMVSAFVGAGAAEQGGASGRERVLRAYREAVAQGYRFFSYGDCMLIV